MTESANKYKILLVDDDQFLVDMYSLKFSQAGHEVSAASSGEEAIEKLQNKEYKPDAVVFDLVMPKIDGFQLLREIREQKLVPDAALIVLSNQGEKEDLEKAKSLGAVGHIVKANAIPSEVLKMVEHIIGNRS